MPSAILPASLTIPRPSDQSLSSCRALATPNFFPPFSFSSFSFAAAHDLTSLSIIRMGGGPRTFPGGVSKWQWKRMQAKKAKQILKARLCRERQLYEMRKRAELKAAISELERPWEVVDRAPVLFSVSADEQVKVLADRFQRPSGFDMWTERDGPQIFRSPDDLPSARFFPKGAVHSVKPYSVIAGDDDEKIRYNDWIARGAGWIGRARRVKRLLTDSGSGENAMSRPAKLLEEDSGESRGSYSSDSADWLAESREEKDMSGAFNRLLQDHGSHGSDKELDGTCSEMEEVEMDSEFGRANGRVTRLSDPELALAGPKVDRREIAGDFSGQSSHGLHSEHIITGSRTEGHRHMSDGFDRRGSHGGYRGPVSRAEREGRGGRNGSRGTYRSQSMLSRAGSKMEAVGEVNHFNRHRISGHNHVSHVSNSEIVAGSGMNDHEKARSFSRRGSRGHLSGYRSSYGYSHLVVDDSTIEGHMAGDFDQHGNRGRGHAVAGWKTEQGGYAGNFAKRRSSFGNRGSYEPYSGDSSVKGDMTAGDFGRRGGHRTCGSDSELALARSRRTREITGSFDQLRSGRGYKNVGTISLVPTTELRLEGGDHGSGVLS